jgi:hypothetical protein
MDAIVTASRFRYIREDPSALARARNTGTATDLNFFRRALSADVVPVNERGAFVWHQHRRFLSGLDRQIYNTCRSFGAI